MLALAEQQTDAYKISVVMHPFTFFPAFAFPTTFFLICLIGSLMAYSSSPAFLACPDDFGRSGLSSTCSTTSSSERFLKRGNHAREGAAHGRHGGTSDELGNY